MSFKEKLKKLVVKRENAIKHKINADNKANDERMKQWKQFSIINFAFHQTLKSSNPAFLYISMV